MCRPKPAAQEERDLLMSQLQQMPGGDIGGMDIVRGDGRSFQAFRNAVKKTIGNRLRSKRS